ncbi:MAG TPA: carbohydrate porin, partial [Acinetobacter nosocomialis]|nr:carbohydrate porin [Acinetobacter nosocomialis]
MPNVIKLSVLTIAVLGSQFALANEPWSQDRQWLLGDWNGERQQLEQQGYKFTASIMSQAATNLDGGYNDSNTFENAAQLSLGATFDLDKIAGWKDTTASLVVTKRDGNALTLVSIKDPRSSQPGNAQEIYA